MSNAQRLAHDPEKVGMKTICLDRGFIFMRCDIAALHENLLTERDSDRISCDSRTILRHVPTLNRSDYRRLVGRREHQLVSYF